MVTTSCSSQELRPRSLPCLAMQVGLHEGSVSDFVCLNKVHLRACPSEEVLPSKLSTLPASAKWVFIAKGGEQVSMLESFFLLFSFFQSCQSVVKDKVFKFAELGGGVVGVVGRSDALVTQPCLDVGLFFEKEPTPLRFCSAVFNKKIAGTLPLTWVL